MSKKVSHLLREYFEEPKRFPAKFQTSMPVKVHPCSWEIHSDPERFSKKFKFETRNRLIDFVNEVMVYEDQARHHGVIRVSHDEVQIDVHTHNVNRITELDQEYASQVDNIHRDVLDFGY